MKFIINEPPAAKARHKHRLVKGRVITYDPQAPQKNYIRTVLKHVLRVEKMPDAPLAIKLTFCLPIPQGWPRKKKLLAAWGVVKPLSKPDTDNLEKFILDCANGILYSDDKIIVDSHSRKIYSLTPRTIVEVEPVAEIVMTKIEEKILSIYTPEKISDMKKVLEELTFLTEEIVEMNPTTIRKIIRNLIVLSNEHAEPLMKINKILDKEKTSFLKNLKEKE